MGDPGGNPACQLPPPLFHEEWRPQIADCLHRRPHCIHLRATLQHHLQPTAPDSHLHQGLPGDRGPDQRLGHLQHNRLHMHDPGGQHRDHLLQDDPEPNLHEHLLPAVLLLHGDRPGAVDQHLPLLLLPRHLLPLQRHRRPHQHLHPHHRIDCLRCQ